MTPGRRRPGLRTAHTHRAPVLVAGQLQRTSRNGAAACHHRRSALRGRSLVETFVERPVHRQAVAHRGATTWSLPYRARTDSETAAEVADCLPAAKGSAALR